MEIDEDRHSEIYHEVVELIAQGFAAKEAVSRIAFDLDLPVKSVKLVYNNFLKR